jgi:hypothetical protein
MSSFVVRPPFHKRSQIVRFPIYDWWLWSILCAEVQKSINLPGPVRYIYLSRIGSIWAVKLHWLDNCLLYTVTDHNITFLVLDSCLATYRNGNSVSADVTDNSLWKRLERRLFQLFLDNLAVVLDLLILQDKHNRRTLSENIKYEK